VVRHRERAPPLRDAKLPGRRNCFG
jgi:hypothetical protein